MRAINNFEKKTIENGSRYRPKDTIFKTLGFLCQKIRKKSSKTKIVKNGPSYRKTVSSSALRSGGSIV